LPADTEQHDADICNLNVSKLNSDLLPIAVVKVVRVFTHICQKVKISLFENTITIYPQKQAEDSKDLHQQKKAYYQEFIEFQSHHRIELIELGLRCFVLRKDLKHEFYHKDQEQFSMNDLHYHLRFKKIDQRVLKKLFTLFAKYNVITQGEKDRFLSHETFYHQLRIMEEKAEKLIEKAKKDPLKYGEASTTADVLCRCLTNLYDIYKRNPTAEGYKRFQEQARSQLNDAKRVLEHHRGCKQVLANIAIAIALMGVGYLVVGLYNRHKNGHFMFFKPKTDSGDKLGRLNKSFMQFIPLSPS
jgi:hypothetical protein